MSSPNGTSPGDDDAAFSRVRIIVFLLIFSILYFGLNAYVVLRLGGFFEIGRPVLYSWIGFVSLSLPLATYGERMHPTLLSSILYTVSTLWMGILLFAGCTLVIYEVVSVFYSVPHAGPIIVVVVSVLTIVSIRNATGIVERHVEVPVADLDTDVSIVHLSDVHLGTIRNSAYLEQVVERSNRLDPDVVMITGDLIDAGARVHEGMFDEFDRLGAPVYFVTGNHEVYEGLEAVYSVLNGSKIRVLKDEIVEDADIQILGVEYADDDGHLGTELEKLSIDRGKPAVLMYHSPEGVADAKRAGIDLLLAGHTHGGQLFPINVVVRMVFGYSTGLHDLGGTFLYLSPGTGTWGPYMRLGSRNEITHITLKAT